ncbi:restriction endonuclease subunit S [Dyadobacter sp. CY323]|uniref:restriction endonuclease subunit S n=1 Tax=Dyadobacter sp. CY323 TaxID=2907302 RepID=UPI001F33F9D5|nr:restriction endonuclease subunit S [Dyadobacter sp. CY323]MCE6988140.1 restriction endonuclease subunit S [Dyadobacter sp. CY323]
MQFREFEIVDLFTVSAGRTTKLYEISNGKTPFVSATDKNNGISAYIDDEPTFSKNLITISRNGSVGEAFFQPLPFCASLDDVRVLTPKGFKLDVLSGIYFCTLIRQEKFRYNYGRKFGTERIKNTKVLLPVKNGSVDLGLIKMEMASRISNSSKATSTLFHKTFNTKPILSVRKNLGDAVWNPFPISTLFDVKKGKRLTKMDFVPGSLPFIGAIDSNNGYREFIGQSAIHTGNTITVNYNGSVGEAFYQPDAFWASDDVNVLYPKFEMNKYVGLFIAAIIRQEQFRFNYGRKWELAKMKVHNIRLPSLDGSLDVVFMEQYMQSLDYSAAI